MTDQTAPATIAIREGIFKQAAPDEPALLIASKCRETGQIFWPPERINPVTGKAGTLEEIDIPGDGRIHAFTVVTRGLPGFPSPYALASIDLDAGPTLLAQLIDWQDRVVEPGTSVELVIGTIKSQKDGSQIVGPLFRPVGNGADA